MRSVKQSKKKCNIISSYTTTNKRAPHQLTVSSAWPGCPAGSYCGVSPPALSPTPTRPYFPLYYVLWIIKLEINHIIFLGKSLDLSRREDGGAEKSGLFFYPFWWCGSEYRIESRPDWGSYLIVELPFWRWRTWGRITIKPVILLLSADHQPGGQVERHGAPQTEQVR